MGGHENSRFLDYLVEDICGKLEVAGFFKHVCEQSITACAGDPDMRFDVGSFTDIAVHHFCSCLVDCSSAGRVPGNFCSLLRGLSRSSSTRITPGVVMADHIIPRVVQTFYFWLTLPDSSMAVSWGESKVSNQLQIVDSLRDALVGVFALDAAPDHRRSIAENAIYAKSIFLASQFYSSCAAPIVDNVPTKVSLQGSADIHNSLHQLSTVNLLFDAREGEKPGCITDTVCLTCREMVFILRLYARAVGRGAVVDRHMSAVATEIENVATHLQNGDQDVVITLGEMKIKGKMESLLVDDVESPGMHELSSAAWLIQAIRAVLKRIRMENDFRANESNLRELTALRDRFCAQSQHISNILRDFRRIQMYREVLMQYRAQINALIDRKEEEPTFGIGTLSDDNFMRYFSSLTFRLQDIESELHEHSRPRVWVNLHFETELGKTRRLPSLRKVLQSPSPSSSPSIKSRGVHSYVHSVRQSLSNRTLKSASPLKMLMQGLFRASPNVDEK